MTLAAFPIVGVFPPLLGAAGFWIELTIAAIAGLLWLVNQIFNNANKPGQPPLQQRPGAPPIPPKKQPGLDDVQEFLRRAAEQRQRPQQKEQKKQQRPQQQQAKKQPQQQGQKKQRSQSRPPRVEVVPEPLRERADAHSSVGDGRSVMDAHLHQVFDHQVGRLTHGTESDDDPATEGRIVALPPAAAIATLFANPESFRQAFILSEILRPLDDHR
jgi:hypothetical protein